MKSVAVTILVPENVLAQLLANGAQISALPTNGQSGKSAKTSHQKRVTHPVKSSSKSSPAFPQKPTLFDGPTSSQLLRLHRRPKLSHRKRLLFAEPCHRPGYLTASQLLVLAAHPVKVGRKVFYPAERENLTSSKLILAHKRQSKRPQLYKGLTASQLLVQHERQQSRSSNYKKYMSSRLLPTSSQLFNLDESSKPTAQKARKLSKKTPNQAKKPEVRGSGKKEQMIQRMTSSAEPRSLLEPTPSLLLLKHLSLIPTLGEQKKADCDATNSKAKTSEKIIPEGDGKKRVQT